jgi:hypothetical protein
VKSLAVTTAIAGVVCVPSIAEQAELIEAEAMYRVVASAPPDLKRKFNVTARRVGGGVVLAAASAVDPSGLPGSIRP